MERIRVVMSKLPRGIFTLIVFLAILWLTLAPKPLGDEPPPMFPGADKIAHGIMFGGLTLMMMLDWQRKHGWEAVGFRKGLVYAAISSLFGVTIEFAQAAMGLGRGFEYSDIVADTLGSFLFAIVWLTLQKKWAGRSEK